MILSGGVLTKTPDRTLWSGTPATWGSGALSAFWLSSYAGIYRAQLWVAVVVNKRARGTARLPLKTYTRDGNDERADAREHPYAQLLRRPNPRLDGFGLWLWTSSTFDIYGEAVWLKVRDAGGRPKELYPIHPSCVQAEIKDGRVVYEVSTSTVTISAIDESDVVHFKTYNPDDPLRGLSSLEPLRSTLENEDAARRATSSFWARGARPGVALSHPGKLSQPAADRLKLQWDNLAAGADKTGTTVVLEEGMKPEVLTISAEEAQYIETRKLNREEVCGAYDVPPPVVHILDHATFSNITEQMRSMYRDTMAPHLKGFEATLESQLRGSMRKGATEPDFGDEVYAEFLLDEVLRGDFEVRAQAYQASINSGWQTPNEVRKLENRPPLPGGDQLFINSTMVPISGGEDEASFDRSELDRVNAIGQLIRAGFDPEAAVSAVGMSPIPHTGLLPITVQSEEMLEPMPPAVVRTLMGRLSRQKSLSEVDPEFLTEGLNGHSAAVKAAYWAALAAGDDVAALRARLKEMA